MTVKFLWVMLFVSSVVVVVATTFSVMTTRQDKPVEVELNSGEVGDGSWHFKHCTSTNKGCGRLE